MKSRFGKTLGNDNCNPVQRIAKAGNAPCQKIRTVSESRVPKRKLSCHQAVAYPSSDPEELEIMHLKRICFPKDGFVIDQKIDFKAEEKKQTVEA